MCGFLFNIYIQYLQSIQFHSYLEYLDLIYVSIVRTVHLITVELGSGILVVEPWVHR
jgi:hypothetical protein